MEKFTRNNFYLDEIEAAENEISANVVFKTEPTSLFNLPDDFDGNVNMFITFRLNDNRLEFIAEYSHSDCDEFIERLLRNRYISISEGVAFAEKLFFSTMEYRKLKAAMQLFIGKNKPQPKIINLFGGPGSGKSTLALEITAYLKKHGYNAEYVSEVAKEILYSGNISLLKNESITSQNTLFSMQKKKIDLCIKGGVDFIVVDSPLLLNLAYFSGLHSTNEKDKAYVNYVVETFNKYNNVNFFLDRESPNYETFGRIQNFSEAIEKDKIIKNILKNFKIPYKKVQRDNLADIMEEIL